MVGVRGVGGVPEPAPERSPEIRSRQHDEVRTPAAQDGIRISESAQQAATVKSMVEIARDVPDIRADRVAAAKASIERGDYKRPDIVAQVAERIRTQLHD